MTSDADTVALLERALDQTARLIAAIEPGQAGLATPCAGWDGLADSAEEFGAGGGEAGAVPGEQAARDEDDAVGRELFRAVVRGEPRHIDPVLHPSAAAWQVGGGVAGRGRRAREGLGRTGTMSKGPKPGVAARRGRKHSARRRWRS